VPSTTEQPIARDHNDERRTRGRAVRLSEEECFYAGSTLGRCSADVIVVADDLRVLLGDEPSDHSIEGF